MYLTAHVESVKRYNIKLTFNVFDSTYRECEKTTIQNI